MSGEKRLWWARIYIYGTLTSIFFFPPCFLRIQAPHKREYQNPPFFYFYFPFNLAKGTFLQLLFYRPILISCMLLHFLSFNFCYPHVVIFFMQTTANALHLLPHNLKSMLCLLRPFPLYQSGWTITLVMNVVYSSW